LTAAVSRLRRGRPWIPPSGLIAGHLAHGLSWVLLWRLAATDIQGVSMPALAWVHLVALGWLSLIALSVMLFVVPQFVDIEWRAEGLARCGLVLFALGAFAMVDAFWNNGVAWLWIAALVLMSGLLSYFISAAMTLSASFIGARTEAAIARAFFVVLLFLVAAAAAGLGMAVSLDKGSSSLLTAGPSVHLSLAGIGWLTLLIMGVSSRTIGPIAGRRSSRRWVHIASTSFVVAAVFGMALGPWGGPVVVRFAGIVCAIGLALYAVDMIAILASSTVPHRPPQAFATAAIVWMLFACVLGNLVIGGASQLSPAFVFIGLIGWVGQMVIAHLHHIGVRLIATIARGDDDETRPEQLLHPVLSWASFVLFQAAVCVAGYELITHSAGLGAAAIAGMSAWTAMTLNMIHAMLWRSGP
jgi:hypothetical protein